MWAKVDDRMWAHPKFMLLTMGARGLWVTALSRCGMYGDPHIPEAFALFVCNAINEDDTGYAQELVDAGLWDEDPDGDGWHVHDWDDYQAAGKSEQKAAAGKVGGLTRALRAAEERATAAEAALANSANIGTEPSESKQGSSTSKQTSANPPSTVPNPESRTRTRNTELLLSEPSGSDDEKVWPVEVVSTCNTVAKLIADNGHTLPRRDTKAHTSWLTEMDRLLRLGPAGESTLPPPTAAEVIEVAEWATSDGFWCAHIQSVPKLRQKWSQLAIQTRRKSSGGGAPAGMDAIAAYARRIELEESA